jgi:hypothetical protein
MALVRHHPLPAPPFMWTLDAAKQLIRERRNLNSLFLPRLANRDHDAAWGQIANNLFAATGFAATSRQCKTKWNALKRGYENLQRILSNNAEGFPLASPNNFDHECFQEMSDQFWQQNSN